MKEINKAARWSSSKTLAKHCNKLIVGESGSFSRTVLESQSCKYIYVVFIEDTGVNICTLSCIIEKHVLLSEFLTLKPHLNERTVTESKNYQIKQALTKCEG